MKKIRVVIADDSVVYRSQIRAALAEVPFVELVGAASNGKDALELVARSRADLLILDIEMPDIDGIETLRRIREQGVACKVLVFSSASRRGAEIVMEALRSGASDFVPKLGAEPGASVLAGIVQPAERIRGILEPKVRALFPELQVETAPVAGAASAGGYPRLIWDLLKPKLVVIGSSTGGPMVLEKIFSEFRGPIRCPIVIAQHMPPIFTAAFAERLSKVSGIPACEAAHDMALVPNRIYVAPGDYHLTLEGTPEKARAVLNQGPQIHSVRPAVDPLFSSAARIFKESCLGFVLTGMGADGRDGAQSIKAAGGAVVIQNEASCVVFGMPGAVHAAGAYDRQATPGEIVQILNEKIGSPEALEAPRAAAGGGACSRS